MFAACGGERGGEAGAPSHCPPDSVPQTPAVGWLPSALPLISQLQGKETLVAERCLVEYIVGYYGGCS